MQNPEHIAEEELLHLLQADDRPAFHYFYKKYHRRVQNYALRFTQCRENAQDVAQDVFLKLWENRKKLANVSCLEAYLFKICKNKSLTLLNRKLCEKRMLLNIVYTGQDFEAEACKQVAAEQFERLIYLAISRLPPRRRHVFRLCKLEGKTHREVAAELHISPGTIHDHIVKATRAIRKFLYLCGSFQET
ncbi:RNA polymerase sigma-70 factor [Dyadobacter aurulentus]|uniref:RNA polymerase sigma-70 factor n=1 Tax=Dyadobacter sp. UC 10 TaxID=2605428 RepID=UPI001788AA9E|nr:RNA polymerase sigma-70 factor [Dyadobacter sp. UC 10]